jgi:hypothetical protein
MTEPQELIDAIIAKLRAVPDLVTDMGENSSAIYAYGETGSPPARGIDDAIKQMHAPSMLLTLQNITVDTRWRWHFALYLRAEAATEDYGEITTYSTIFHHFVEGVSGEDEVRFFDTSIHDNFDPMENVSLERAVADDGLEYWYVRFDLSEIGG